MIGLMRGAVTVSSTFKINLTTILKCTLGIPLGIFSAKSRLGRLADDEVVVAKAVRQNSTIVEVRMMQIPQIRNSCIK
jgi:hypothetical protein